MLFTAASKAGIVCKTTAPFDPCTCATDNYYSTTPPGPLPDSCREAALWADSRHF